MRLVVLLAVLLVPLVASASYKGPNATGDYERDVETASGCIYRYEKFLLDNDLQKTLRTVARQHKREHDQCVSRLSRAYGDPKAFMAEAEKRAFARLPSPPSSQTKRATRPTPARQTAPQRSYQAIRPRFAYDNLPVVDYDLPAPEPIIARQSGADRIDTAARKVAAATVLHDLTRFLSGTTGVDLMPPKIAARNQDYLNAQGAERGAIEHSFTDEPCNLPRDQCQRPRYFKATWGYEFNEEFLRDVLSTVPENVRSRYLAYKDSISNPKPAPQNAGQGQSQVAQGSGVTFWKALTARATVGAPSTFLGWLAWAAVVFVALIVIAMACQLLSEWWQERKWQAGEPERKRKEKERERARKARLPTRVNAVVLKNLGPDEKARTKAIDEIFDRAVDDLNYPLLYVAADHWGGTNAIYGGIDVTATLIRPLSLMPPRQREATRVAFHLLNQSLIPDERFAVIFPCLVFSEGQAQIIDDDRPLGGRPSLHEMVAAILHDHYMSNVEAAIAEVFSLLGAAIANEPDNPVIKSLAARLLGGRGFESAPTTVGKHPPLQIGRDQETGRLHSYGGEGSLVTIARAGAGKTRCHVIPNLLSWTGAAVVLDIKGELYSTTSLWRSRHVGPVYRFGPLDTSHATHSYNPLAFVRPDTDHLWEDAGLVASTMIVPSSGNKDPFWENKARDVVRAAIASACIDGGKGQIKAVLDVIHGVDWDGFIKRLKNRLDLDPMYRAGHSLDSMEPKVKDSVLQTAQASLSAWESPQVVNATRHSDWNPNDLRKNPSPTIYICVQPHQIESLLSVLRVVISQHISLLLSGTPDPSKPILFMLDELPQLRYMAPIEQALAVGRQYGLKLWMFAQYLSQFQNVYENADGMLGNCGIRLFMNPSMADGTAQRLSAEIGDMDSVLDGSRHRKVDPQDLAGEEYVNDVLCFETGRKPYVLEKYPIDKQGDLRQRMGSV